MAAGSARSTRTLEVFAIVEQDEDGWYVGEVPQLEGCYAQGRTLDELMANLKEVVQLCWELASPEERRDVLRTRVVGLQRLVVDVSSATASGTSGGASSARSCVTWGSPARSF